MASRFAAIGGILTVTVALGAAAAQQPRITNARVAPRSAGTLQQTFRTLMAGQTDPAWIGYAVPVRNRNLNACCWDGQASCRIEPGDRAARTEPSAMTQSGPIKLEGPETIVVLFRIAGQQVERIRTFSEACELDAGGLQVHWLQDVRPADSVALLESMVSAEGSGKRRLTSAALAAMSMHGDPSAVSAIERLARSHAAAQVRGDALFWLAQMAGATVAAAITDAIANDPETDVKRRAVFALSQLPRGEGVPLLIDVARKNPNPAVKKQAMFWLGQSKDPRAIDFLAEILK